MPARKHSVSDLRGGTEALKSPYFGARLFRTPCIVLLTRTSQVFDTVAEIERTIEDLARSIPLRTRSGWSVIIDSRLSPTRVNPALEPAFERLRRESQAGFSCVAVIVATPLGKMRSERLSNVSDVPVRTVGSIEEALEFFNAQPQR
jgi:hypothetical protein